jgi:hypothetical protein
MLSLFQLSTGRPLPVISGWALGLALLVFAPAVDARVGPTLLCFPLDIGEAWSLPFGEDAFATQKGFTPQAAAAQSLALLERNICETMGVFLGSTDPVRLAALVAAKVRQI